MTKNSKGGNKNRRRGRKFSKPQSRELILKQSGQEYGRLEKNLGNHHFECLCADGIVRRANIPGSFQKRYWMRVQDYVLVSIRIGLNHNECDILYKYNPNEVNQLQERGLIDQICMDGQENGIDEEDILEEIQETDPKTENILSTIDDDFLNDI